jgi:hypothetical protein
MTINTKIFLAIALANTLILGSVFGKMVGRVQACESVKMEWVNDRCMLVTRQDFK